MTHDDRGHFAGQRVGPADGGDEDGASLEFVEIGTADAAPLHGDQHLTRARVGAVDIFHPQVTRPVEP